MPKGRLLALRGRLCHDHGSCTPYGVALAYNAGTNVVGPYVLPAYRLDINWCLTNFVPCAPTRGAGRPQGMYVMERLLDAIAARLGVPRDEIRRRNMIKPSQMPYPTPIRQRDGSTMTYDSGDYPECQRRALDVGGWAEFPARQAAARRKDAISDWASRYVEGTGRGRSKARAAHRRSAKIVVTTARARRARAPIDAGAACRRRAERAAGKHHRGQARHRGTALGFGAFATRPAVTAGDAGHRPRSRCARKR